MPNPHNILAISKNSRRHVYLLEKRGKRLISDSWGHKTEFPKKELGRAAVNVPQDSPPQSWILPRRNAMHLVTNCHFGSRPWSWHSRTPLWDTSWHPLESFHRTMRRSSLWSWSWNSSWHMDGTHAGRWFPALRWRAPGRRSRARAASPPRWLWASWCRQEGCCCQWCTPPEPKPN